MTVHATTNERYERALQRARKWRMLHQVDAQRASSHDATEHGYYVGTLMRRDEDGVLWYGDSPDDYPAQGSAEVTPLTEHQEAKARIVVLERTLRDVTGGDYDLGYSPADTIAKLREELAALKAERDAAVKRAEVAELSRHNALSLCAEREEMLKRAVYRVNEITTWKRGAPSEPGWYPTRGPNLLAADHWDGVTWLASHPSESTEHLPIRLDKCAEPAPASPYATEHKPEDIEDA